MRARRPAISATELSQERKNCARTLMYGCSAPDGAGGCRESPSLPDWGRWEIVLRGKY